jgi:predicted DNA binding CopG/RHH family protein
MAITKKPAGNANKPAQDKFIEAAPDGTKASKPDDEGSVQITLRMSRDQLERISRIAKRQGIPRASYIKRSVFIQLEGDERSNG